MKFIVNKYLDVAFASIERLLSDMRDSKRLSSFYYFVSAAEGSTDGR